MDGQFDLGPIFDMEMAIELRDEAIERVGQNASAWWMRSAMKAIATCVMLYPQGFTTDEVWAALAEGAEAHDNRAMGAAMRQAQIAGLIRPTSIYRQSSQVSCHGRPKRVWTGATTQ